MDPLPVAPPREWLEGLVTRLAIFAEGRPRVEGVAGGPLWLSLRMDGRFLWLLAQAPLRMCWLDEKPTPGPWLQLLGRHHDSPFARRLRGTTLVGAELLVADSGIPDGLLLRWEPPLRSLSLRFFPRPGAIWLDDQNSEILAQQGRMEGEVLRPKTVDLLEFDQSAHAKACRSALEQHLDEHLDIRLRRQIRNEDKRQTRRAIAQESELERARNRLGLRGKADLLAAHLHEIKGPSESVELVGFDGAPVEIQLDPTLNAAGNLKALYRAASKAERTVTELERRINEMQELHQRRGDPLEALELCSSLEDRLRFAAERELEPFPKQPTEKTAAKRQSQRLPYYAFVLESGRELRVGRSARDNDSLLRQFSDGKDLWFHAQGVEGSHVLLRSASGPVSPAEIEIAARLAAQFSKAKHSKLVPVLVTERRYVRKPRKAATGSVVAERAKTLFVEPGIADGCRRKSTLD